MLPRKFFEQFPGKFCFNSLPLTLSASPNMMHFVRTFSNIRAYGVRARLIVIDEVCSYGKIVFIQNILKNGWWGDASHTSPPLGSAPVCVLKSQLSKGFKEFTIVLLALSASDLLEGGGANIMCLAMEDGKMSL